VSSGLKTFGKSKRRAGMVIFLKMPSFMRPRNANRCWIYRFARSRTAWRALRSGERVVFGATVALADGDTGDKVVYQIVGDHEAEPKNGKISISSPVARALIGKSEGDEVQVQTPTGVRSFEILSVEYID
jgi:transcription elongation GreA/GreB family factor